MRGKETEAVAHFPDLRSVRIHLLIEGQFVFLMKQQVDLLALLTAVVKRQGI